MSQKPFSSDAGFITSGNITTGNLEVTGNFTGANLGNITAVNLNGNASTVLAGDGTWVAQTGGNGGANLGNLNVFNNTIFAKSGNTPTGYVNYDTGAGLAVGTNTALPVSIITDNAGANHNWRFDETGNLTLPGNTFAVNYANGTPVSISGGGANYGDSNVTALLSSGNVTTNIETTANITAQVDVYAFNNVRSYGNVTASANITALPGGYFIGDGGLLSNISTGVTTGNIIFSSSTISTDQASDILITGANGNAVAVISNAYAELQWTSDIANATGADANSQYVWVDVDGAHILTDDLTGNTYQWDFNTSGGTGLPGDLFAGGNTYLGQSGTTTQISGNLNLGVPGLSQRRIPFINTVAGGVSGNANLQFNPANATFQTVNAQFDGDVTANGIMIVGGTNLYFTNYANIQGAGNVYANYFVGDGSYLTGLAPAYANTNAIAMMNSGLFTGDFVPNGNSTQNLGNLTNRWKSVYLAGNTIYLGDASLSSAGGGLEINGAAVITEDPGGNIDVPQYVNAGGVHANSLLINGDTVITGNANVQGTLTYNNLTNLTTSNLVLGLGNTQTGVDVTGGGIVVGNTNEAQWLYDQPAQSWVSNINVTSNANITASYFLGDGSQLTNLPVQSGTYGNANVSAYLNDNYAITFNTTGNITSGNLTTGVAVANSATVYGNITAANLGNIAALNLTGNSSQVLYGDGSFGAVAGGTGNYGDSNVVNLLSAFGSNGIVTTGGVTFGSVNVYGNINSVGNTANAFTTANTVNIGSGATLVNIGNTSGLTNLLGNIQGSTNGFAIGYRDIPQVAWVSNTTIQLSDAGKHYYANTGSNMTLTIANSATTNFAIGAAINIINQGIGTMTIAQGSGVTLYLAGNAVAGNRTVSSYGMATIQKVATNTWFIVGVGVN